MSEIDKPLFGITATNEEVVKAFDEIVADVRPSLRVSLSIMRFESDRSKLTPAQRVGQSFLRLTGLASYHPPAYLSTRFGNAEARNDPNPQFSDPPHGRPGTGHLG